MTQSAPTRIPAESLHAFMNDVFIRMGCDAEHARSGADVLLASDLRGIESHGSARLHVYVKWLAEDSANPNPQVTITRETAATLALDGAGGLGIMVAPQAMRLVIDRAKSAGGCWATVKRSNHFGIAGYYAMLAAAEEMIGWSMSNATAQIHAWGGFQAMLGTNPIAIAFPSRDGEPVVIDMASSTSAYGKIEIAHRAGQPIPSGWAIDEQGHPVTDTNQIVGHVHRLTPLGATPEHGGHKGYCLASMIDLMTGVLGGATWGPWCPHFFYPQTSREEGRTQGLGHSLAAFRIDSFREPAEYFEDLEKWKREMRAVPPADPKQPVVIPGEPERSAHQDRSVNGIPLSDAVWATLCEVSEQTGVKFQ